MRTTFRHWRDRFAQARAHDRTIRGALILLGGSVGAHAITVLLMPVLTRVASPEELGGLARFVSVVGVLLPVVSLRYEWAIPLARTAGESGRLVQLSGLLLLAAAALAALAAATTLATRDSRLPLELLLLAPGLLVLGGVQILSSWTIRTGAFAEFARSRLLQSLFVGTGQIALCALLGGPLSLIGAYLGGQVLAYLALTRMVWRDARAGLAQPDAPSLAGVAGQYRRFPTLSAPSSLLNSLGVEAPILLVSTFAGTAVAGQLALGQRVAALPGVLVRESLGQAFYTEAARLAATDPAALRRLYRRTVKHMALAGAAVPLVFALAPVAFPIVFGSIWAPAGWMAFWLSIMVFAQISLGTVSCLEYLDAQGLNMAWNAGRLLVVTAGVLVPHAAGVSDITMVAVYSCAAAAWYPMLYAMNEISLSRAIARHPGVSA